MKSLSFKATEAGDVVWSVLAVIIVLMLIISLMPMIDGPATSKTCYICEGIPLIGNLRTRIGVYQYENNNLPGTMNRALASSVSGSNITGVIRSSKIVPDPSFCGVQAFVAYASTTNPANEMCYAYAMFGDTNFIGGVAYPSGLTGEQAEFHFAKQLDIDNEELIGRWLRPDNFQYIVSLDGNSSYIYAIGVFGTGADSIPRTGTGYAILDLADRGRGDGRRIVATWKRWKPGKGLTTQLRFVCSDDPRWKTPEAARRQNVVWVPDVSYIGDGPNAKSLESDLKAAGWEL